MIANKSAGVVVSVGVASSQPQLPSSPPECCMCGDCGLSHELFQCKVCQFRSQHKYCSNLYPKAESYQVCNWCLNRDAKEKSQNSSNSSSSNKNANNNSEDDSSRNSKNNNNNNNNNKKRSSSGSGGSSSNNGDNIYNQRSGLKGQRPGSLQLQVINSPIKKQRSPERSPSVTTTTTTTTTTPRRRLISNGKLEEKLRRTKSLDMSNNSNGITKPVFRNKVRRYKLLEEVSS